MGDRARRQQLTKLFTQVSSYAQSGNMSQMHQMVQISKKAINSKSNSNTYSELNTFDETNKDYSLLSTSHLQRDNLVTLLKTENNSLDLENKRLRRELDKLSRSTAIDPVSEQYQPPYIKMREELSVFVNKVFIRPQQYDIIEYDPMWVILMNEVIKIYRSSDENEVAKATLNLRDITTVKYLDECMLIEFELKPEGLSKYLMIKFNDKKHLKKWDYALYINKETEACLAKDKLFQQEKEILMIEKEARPNLKIDTRRFNNSLYNKTRKVSYNEGMMQKSSLEGQNPENMMRKSFSVKNGLGDKDTIKQSKESKDNSEKRSNSNISNISKKYDKEKERTEQLCKEIAQRRKQVKEMKGVDSPLLEEKIRWGNDEEESKEYKESKEYRDQKQHDSPIRNYNNSFGDSFNFVVKPVDTHESRVREEHPLDTSTFSNNNESIKKVIRNLRKPKDFVKCSKDGYRGHSKEVYLSQNEVQLCWKDLKNNRIRKIKIDDITDLSKGQKDKGLRKHAQKINPEHCLVIRTQNQTVELYCENKHVIDDFAKDLDTLMRMRADTTSR